VRSCLFLQGNGAMRKRIIPFVIVMVLSLLSGCGTGPGGAYLKVDPDRCIGCGECFGVCPVDAVRIIAGKAVIDPTKCVTCGRCVEVCPVNAIN
jgi:ferredoxin